MIYTEEQKRNILRNAGYDPAKYDYNEALSLATPKEETVASNPSPNSEPLQGEMQKQQSSSALGAAWRHAKYSTIPTLTGFAGGIAGAGVGMPIAGPLTAVPLGLAGAIGGSLAGEKYLNPLIFSEADKEQLAYDAQQYPKSSFAGGMAPTLPFFNPVLGVRNLTKIPGILNRARAGGALSPGEKGLLLNTAINTGVAGTQDVLAQKESKEEFNPVELLLHTLGAASINAPWGPGKLLFPSTEDNPARPSKRYKYEEAYPALDYGSPQLSEAQAKSLGIGEFLDKQGQKHTFLKDAQEQDKLLALKEFEEAQRKQKILDEAAEVREDTIRNKLVGDQYIAEQQRKQAEQLASQKLEQEKQLANKKLEQEINAEMEAEEAAKIRRVEDFKKAQAELENQQIVNRTLEIERLRRENEQRKLSLAAGNLKGIGEEAPMAERLQEQMQKNTVSTEENIPVVATPKNEKLAINPEDTIRFQKKSELDPALTLGEKKMKELVREQEKLAHARGFGTTLGPVPTNPKALGSYSEIGQEVPRLITANPEIAKGDTIPHETGHGFMRDLKLSKNPRDNKLYQKGLDAVKNKRLSPEEQKIEQEMMDELLSQKVPLKEANERVLEERAAMSSGKLGYESTVKKLYGTSREKFKNWFEELKVNLKEKTGLASDEEVLKLIDQRVRYDTPFGTEPGIYRKPGINPPVIQNQEKSELKGGEIDAQRQEERLQRKEGNVALETREERIPPTSLQEISAIESETPPKEPRFTRDALFPSWSSAADKVSKISPEGGEAVRNFLARRQNYQAQFRGVPMEAVAKLKPTSQEQDDALAFIRAKYRKTGDEPELSPRAERVVEIVQDTMRKVRETQNEKGLEVETEKGEFRKGHLSDFYISDMLSDKAIAKFTRIKNVAEQNAAEASMRDWAKYVHDESNRVGGREIPVDEAYHNISESISALGKKSIDSVEFNALIKAAGYGIPENLRETNLLKILSKYGRRAAAHLAYWEEIQNKPKIAALFKLKDRSGHEVRLPDVTPINDVEAVQGALRFVFNDTNKNQSPNITTAIRMITSGLLGPGTAIKNVGNVPALFAPYLETTKDVGALFQGIGNLTRANEIALRKGLRSGSMDADRWRMLENPNKVAETFNKIADFLRRYQGRELSDNMEAAYGYAVAEELIKSRIFRAIAGDQKALNFLRKNGTLVDEAKLKDPSLLEEADIEQLATNFTGTVKGTYDARGLPAGAFDSEYAPFFSLSRWSIEKSNVIWKDVLRPALNGENYTPLLVYTLGSVLTGVAFRKLNELISGKKDYTPSVKEAITEENKKYAIAAFVNLLQLGSFAGIYSDMLKVGSDVFIQHEYPRGPVNFPAADFLTETLMENLTDYVAAISNGEDKLNTTFRFIYDTLKGQVQGLRLIHSRLIDPESSERQNKFRDVRVFKKLQEKEDVRPLAAYKGNEYLGVDEKKFKRTSDLGEAATLAPELITKAADKSAGDRSKFDAKIRSLKGNSYQTFPNPKNDPQGFQDYLNFLTETQGEQVAKNRLYDYMLQNQINRRKNEMLP